MAQARIERNTEMNCPKCGSKPASSEYNGMFECGTVTDSSGSHHHTVTCQYFSEFRKPLDQKIADLDSQLKDANYKIAILRDEQRESDDYSRRLNWKIKDLCAERDAAIAGKLKKNNGLL
jgi:hypothetical protein